MNWLERHLQPGRCFIIAEAGINHNGHFDLALELVSKAKEVGADCIKFQTFFTDSCETDRSLKPGYFDSRESGLDKLAWSRSLELSAQQFQGLYDLCKELDIEFLSTACDEKGLRILLGIGVEAVKIGSSDTTNLPLLRGATEAGMEAIISTGMSSMKDIERAVAIFRERSLPVAVLQCTSQYPAPPDQINLRAIHSIGKDLGVPVGYSDHSCGDHVAIASVAMGARVLEKHFTLSRELPGVDHAASLEPDEFRNMLRRIREVEAAMGSGEKTVQDCERDNLLSMRKSLMAGRDLAAGTRLTLSDVKAKRPGDGIGPEKLDAVLGRRLCKGLRADDMLDFIALEDA